jgi:hypothetical protein
MYLKVPKGPKYTKFSIPSPTKIKQNLDFWSENKPSGKPAFHAKKIQRFDSRQKIKKVKDVTSFLRFFFFFVILKERFVELLGLHAILLFHNISIF